MKVLFGTDFAIQRSIIDHFTKLNNKNLEFIVPEQYDDETLLKYAPETEILIRPSVSKEFLEQAPNLKHIQIPWTGSDRVDFGLLKNFPKITVSNSHSNSLTIAEHTVALLFSVAKQVNYRDKHMRNGDWSPRTSNENFSFPLTGMTVGILGFGAIGQKVAKMLKSGFDMKVLAIKRDPIKLPNERIFDYIGGIKDIPKVLQESDFIIVSLPLTSETKDIISFEQFKLMKQGAVIVNIARGPIINEQALYEFLKNKKGFAGIDVWYNYPKRSDDTEKPTFQNFPFEELDNIIMSPHSAFKVRDIGMKTGKDIIENLQLLASGKEPINLLNMEAGY